MFFFVHEDSLIEIKKQSALKQGTIIRTAEKKAKIIIGCGCYIGYYSLLEAKKCIEIGDNSCIAEHVSIRDHDHKIESGQLIAMQGYKIKDIFIGNDVWIGAKSMLLMSSIGHRSVVGAHSFVNKDYSDDCIIFGIPGRIFRKRI